jgi:hypothetical protein
MLQQYDERRDRQTDMDRPIMLSSLALKRKHHTYSDRDTTADTEQSTLNFIRFGSTFKSFVKAESCVGFEVLTAASMKIDVFWVVTSCNLVKVYQRFRGACCFYHRPDKGGSKDL